MDSHGQSPQLGHFAQSKSQFSPCSPYRSRKCTFGGNRGQSWTYFYPHSPAHFAKRRLREAGESISASAESGASYLVRPPVFAPPPVAPAPPDALAPPVALLPPPPSVPPAANMPPTPLANVAPPEFLAPPNEVDDCPPLPTLPPVVTTPVVPALTSAGGLTSSVALQPTQRAKTGLISSSHCVKFIAHLGWRGSTHREIIIPRNNYTHATPSSTLPMRANTPRFPLREDCRIGCFASTES